MAFTELNTQRLDLLKPDLRYASDIHDYATDPIFCALIDAEPSRSKLDAIEFIERLIRENNSGLRHYWIAVDRKEGRAVGTLGLLFTDARRHRTAEIGYGFSRKVWGTGLFPEAMTAVLRHTFNTLGIYRVQAITRADNTASIRGVEKLGMRREALLRSYYQTQNSRVDAVVMSILSNEFNSITNS